MKSMLEQELLNLIQDGFPLENRPYQVLVERLQRENPVEFCAIGEATVFQAVERLRESGVIRRIGAVYDSRKLGFTSRLCCGQVPESALEEFAAAALDEPSITHNYVRSHAFNVWFTVIGKSAADIAAIVQKLQQRTALTNVHILDSKRMFKINTVMGKKEPLCSAKDSANNLPTKEAPLTPPLLQKCRSLLAEDIPHTLTPFATIAAQIVPEISEMQVINAIRQDLRDKKARRFGAILRHQKAGFTENAMVVLKVAGDNVEAAGRLLSSQPQVSHCYERNSFDAFPYNLYAMIHSENEGQLNALVAEIIDKLNNPEFCVLRSVKELKKTSFNYFV